MSYNVQTIIDGVSQDIRGILDSKTAGASQTALIDWTNRRQNEMLRWSNWEFVLSDPQYFITDLGQTDYWLGPIGQRPVGVVDTRLNLSDIDKIKKDTVRDLSNFRALKWNREAPIGPGLNYPGGGSRPGQPAGYRQDPNTKNILSIYPAPDNQNTFQPIPSTPIVDTIAGGALANRVYFIKVTLVDDLGGESTASNIAAKEFIGATNLAIVRSPTLIFGGSTSGVKYSKYNVYATLATGYPQNPADPQTETLQNVSPISIGTDWNEPSTGLTTNGVAPPRNSTLEQLGGYVITFRYLRARNTISTVMDIPQIPEKYKDILIAGVSASAWDLIGDPSHWKLAYDKFQDGYRQMVVDKNLFPDGLEFIRPDTGSYVNQQILGYLPPFF